jgi:hypothetical protein
MRERGATMSQVHQIVLTGMSVPAKFGRTKFSLVVPFNGVWNGRRYPRKQIDAIAAKIKSGWIVVTVVVKYF